MGHLTQVLVMIGINFQFFNVCFIFTILTIGKACLLGWPYKGPYF